MARLHESSDDEFPDLKDLLRPLHQPTCKGKSDDKIRAHQANANTTNSQAKRSVKAPEPRVENSSQEPRLVPKSARKNKAVASSSGRQRPLKSVRSNALLFPIPKETPKLHAKKSKSPPMKTDAEQPTQTPGRNAKKKIDYAAVGFLDTEDESEEIDIEEAEDSEYEATGIYSNASEDGDVYVANPKKSLQEPQTERRDEWKLPTAFQRQVIKTVDTDPLNTYFEFHRPSQRIEVSNQTSSRPSTSSSADNRAILKFSPPRKNSPHKSKPNRPTTPPPSTPPTSPSKTKLISPSKKGRIPPTPHRPSNEAFWNQAFTNDWNDEYSPRKKPESPKKQKFGKSGPGSGPDSEETSMEPKAMQKSPTKRDRKAIEARKQFEIQKHALADTFLKELDDKITGGKVAEMTKEKGGVRIVWSKKLNSTAGRAHWRKEGKKTKGVDGTIVAQYWHDAWIELAEKVIDDEERLINVIAHEFCHLANYIVSGIKDKPHGQQFKAWGKKVGAAFGGRGVEVTTTHSYKIDYKYIWACSKCGHEYKRHSKSIDPKRHCCAKCKSLLIQTKPVARSAGPSEYQLFVKAHFQRVKKENGGASHGAVMEILGRMYRESKAGKTEPVSSVDGAEDIIDEVVKAVEVITLKD